MHHSDYLCRREHPPVEIERDRVRTNVGRKHSFELVKVDSTGAIPVYHGMGVNYPAGV